MEQKRYELIDAVLGASASRCWGDAVLEWCVAGCDEDEECGGVCVCGHEGLRYLYEIRNPTTHAGLYPIGSRCIGLFRRRELDLEASNLKRLTRLMGEAARLGRGRLVDIKSGFYSRALIDCLRERGAFGEDPPRGRNRDYATLRRLFGARGLDGRRHALAMEIIGSCVYPWMRGYWRQTREARRRLLA